MKAGARVEANAAEMRWCPRAGAKPNSHNSVITATGLEQRTMLESWGAQEAESVSLAPAAVGNNQL